MFNPHQRGGTGTLMGDIDKVAHTHYYTHTLDRLDERQEGGLKRRRGANYS